MDGLIDGRPLSGTESLLILQISVWNLKVTFGLSALEKKSPPKSLFPIHITDPITHGEFWWTNLGQSFIYILYIHVYSGDVCFFLD